MGNDDDALFYSSEPFRVLCADPPWKFGDKLPGPKRGAEKHYDCMTVEQIAAFPLPTLANDCLLCLWRVASMQLEALAVVEAWGFSWPTTEMVWVKTVNSVLPHTWTEDQEAEHVRLGMGRTLRNVHEVALFCKRGKPRIDDHSIPSVIFAPRGQHSEKPEIFYDLVERLTPGPRVELFARRRRPGWLCLGNQLTPAAASAE